jgi:predicted dehydrogenase
MRQFNVLVIGLGSIGKRHIKILKETIACKILVMRNKNKVAEDLPGVDKYVYGWKGINRENIDFAIICTPTALHINSALALARRNIPFLIEKPVSASLNKVNELVRLVNSKKLPVLVGFNLRHHFLYKKIKKIISSGELGKILAYFSETGQYLPQWRSYDYTKSCSSSKELGGGVIFDLTHEIDLAADFLGNVERAVCFKGKLSDLKVNTEDLAEITFVHKNGAVSHIHLDYLQRQYTRRMKLIFENGEILWDYALGNIKVISPNRSHYYHQPNKYSRDDTFRAQLKHWIKVLDFKEHPEADLKTGIYVSKLAISAHLSAKKNEWVRIR